MVYEHCFVVAPGMHAGEIAKSVAKALNQEGVEVRIGHDQSSNDLLPHDLRVHAATIAEATIAALTRAPTNVVQLRPSAAAAAPAAEEPPRADAPAFERERLTFDRERLDFEREKLTFDRERLDFEREKLTFERGAFQAWAGGRADLRRPPSLDETREGQEPKP